MLQTVALFTSKVQQITNLSLLVEKQTLHSTILAYTGFLQSEITKNNKREPTKA